MSHIKPVTPKPGFDENGIYKHHYDPKYLSENLDERRSFLKEWQKEAAQWEDDFRDECRQGGR